MALVNFKTWCDKCGKVKGTRLVLASFRRLRFDVKNDEPFKEKPPKGDWIEVGYLRSQA